MNKKEDESMTMAPVEKHKNANTAMCATIELKKCTDALNRVVDMAGAGGAEEK